MTNVVDDLTKSGSGEVGAVPNVGNDAGGANTGTEGSQSSRICKRVKGRQEKKGEINHGII